MDETFRPKGAQATRSRSLNNTEHHYETKTRGERQVPAARPAGEGVYALLQRGRDLHLTYELELPERPGEVQEEFNIPQQGAYILSIANPERSPPPGAGLSEREEVHYPKQLQQEFAAGALRPPILRCSISRARNLSWSARVPIRSAPMTSTSRPSTRPRQRRTFSDS